MPTTREKYLKVLRRHFLFSSGDKFLEMVVDDLIKANEPETFLEPKEYLKLKCVVEVEQMHMKSRLGNDEFEMCITQWSLKCVEMGWEYSGDEAKDLRRLKAGLQKWCNTWTNNNRNKNGAKNKPDDTIGKISRQVIEDYLKGG